MMDRLLRADPRTLLLAMTGLVLILLATGWQSVLRKPVADYRELRRNRTELAKTAAQGQSLPSRLEEARHQAEQAEQQLSALLRAGPEDETTVALVRGLDRAAAATGVTLVSVRPLEPRRIGEFAEQAFEAEARGAYAGLVNWVATVEAELHPSLVTGFVLRPGAGTLTLALTVSSFRIADTPKGNAS